MVPWERITIWRGRLRTSHPTQCPRVGPSNANAEFESKSISAAVRDHENRSRSS